MQAPANDWLCEHLVLPSPMTFVTNAGDAAGTGKCNVDHTGPSRVCTHPLDATYSLHGGIGPIGGSKMLHNKERKSSCSSQVGN